MYELKRALNNLTQGEDMVNNYYGKLKSLWDELLYMNPYLHVVVEIWKFWLNDTSETVLYNS